MGMFDSVECRYPLPTRLAPGVAFQTKDLTTALLHYVISEEGRLEESSRAEDRSGFTGTINLRWSNVVAYGPGLYTAGGEDAHYLQYAVTFVNGGVVRVEELENRHEPALAFAQWPHREMPSAEENRARREREQECLTGRTLWLWWGGRETGHPVTVIAENNRQLVVQTADKRFQIVDRFSRDQTLFDSEQDGRRLLEERQAKRERQRREYEDAIQNRTQAAADSAKNSISRAESE